MIAVMSDYYEGAGDYDRETVRFFDIAHEGAQVRAIIDALPSLANLRGMQPRSVIVVATDQVARAAARAVAQVRAPLPLPVVVTDTLPGYVGALDVVVMVGDAAARERDVRALLTAAQRGAETVLAGPARGPIVDEAPASTVIVPALPTTMGPSPARTIAVLSAVLDALDPRAAAEALAERFRMLADELDAELTAVSPERAEDVNAARQLRAFARDARVVHSGTTRHGLALAELVATLWSCRGLASGFVDADELPQALELARGGAPAPADDIFHDPFLDGPVELVPLKVVLWAQPDAPAPVAPNTRAETVASQHLGESVTVLRLLARAYAVTALDDPSDG